MPDKPDNSVPAYFDAHAEAWDETTYSPEHRQRIPIMVEKMNIQPGAKILDVGTGTGILIPWLLQKTTASGRIVALDISGRMLAQTARKYAEPNLFLLQAPVEEIPLRASGMDVAVCLSVFPHFQHHPRALRELQRVVRPGGYLYIVHLEGSESLNRFHAGLNGPVRHHRLPDLERMGNLLHSCGWTVQSSHDTETGYFVAALRP